jgi:hypothetical protein
VAAWGDGLVVAGGLAFGVLLAVSRRVNPAIALVGGVLAFFPPWIYPAFGPVALLAWLYAAPWRDPRAETSGRDLPAHAQRSREAVVRQPDATHAKRERPSPERCVHAGIAAADTVTAHRLELPHTGDNHSEAVALLRQVEPDGTELAGHPAALLGLKTKAGYTHRPVSGQERLQAGRRAHALVDSARGLRLP